MKNKISKIIFVISFLPYLLTLIYGIISAFSGISFFYNTIYGFEAFLLAIIGMLLALIFIPIIPICLIFQICYILRKKVKKINSIKLKKYIKICVIVGIFLISFFIVSTHQFEIEQMVAKVNAKRMSNNSEEKIGFCKNDSSYSVLGIEEYNYSHIFIDYDKLEVGMLVNSSVDDFWKVKLEKTSKDSFEYQHIINDYFVQADISLNLPGEKLISFYEAESNNHRTIAFLLIYEDGTIYFADNIKEKDTGFTRFTGLHWSEFFVGENVKFNEWLSKKNVAR